MKKIINDYVNYTVPFYGPADFVVKKAKGSYVWDINNKKYIDFTAGIAVTNLGHSNSELTKILNQQSKNVWHLSNLYINEHAVQLSKKLCQKTFADKVFFCNSGAESIEAAVKTARKYTSKKFKKDKNEIISFSSSFHGRTMLGIALAKAKNLITAAKECGADYAKFQFYDAENLVVHSHKKAQYKLRANDGSDSHFDMLKKLTIIII